MITWQLIQLSNGVTIRFNPWSGCSKISAGCANCYAAVNYSVKVRGVKWGPQGNRIVKAESGWKEPLKWDREAALGKAVFDANGDRHRPRVFCASLADVFEDWNGPMLNSLGGEIEMDHRGSAGEVPVMMTMQDVRNRLFALIDATPNLDWLVLTKRPENIAKMMPAYFPGGYIAEAGGMNQEGPRPNLWLGTSPCDQPTADRLTPELLKCRDLCRVLFLSCEPLLGPIDLEPFLQYEPFHENYKMTFGVKEWRGIDWAIIGGESGHGARPCRVDWIRSIVKQCKAAGVACFVKQMGGNIVTRNDMIEDVFNDGESGWPDPNLEHNINGFREEHQGADCRIRLNDKKGGDMAEWPDDLRVRQFPNADGERSR